MIFNGHTVDSINSLDEATMNEITVLYADGMLGNGGTLKTIGSLVAGAFNYIKTPATPAYTLKSILGQSYNYIFSEQEVSADDSLLVFMSQSQGFNMDRFKKD